MPSQTIAQNFLDYAVNRIHHSEREIQSCCAQLTEDQLWQRGADHENSIANLLLHLEGNMRQWILHGIAGEPDVRQRDAEFTLTPTVAAAAALQRLSGTISTSCAVIEEVTPERLLEVIDPQPTGTVRHPTVLEAIFQVAGHVQLHAAQIVLLTKQLVARDLDLSMPRKR